MSCSAMRVAIAAAAPGRSCTVRPHVIAALVALHRRARRHLRGVPTGRPNGACGPAARHVGDVGDHRRGGRVAAGAGPDSVSSLTASASIATALVTPITCAMAEVRRHHGRVHALLDAAFGALGDAEQLDAVAEFVGHREIERRDGGDAFDIDRVGVDLRAEGEAGQDGELVRRVVALDVEGRVGLGIAEPLRILEAVVEGQALRPPCASGCSCRCR